MFSYENVHVLLISSDFTSNRADYGGVVYSRKNVDVSLTSSDFTSNRANYGGVVCSVENVDVSLTSSDFTNNRASQGGCFSLADSVYFKVKGSIFRGNEALKYGAVAEGVKSLIHVSSSHFEHNNGTAIVSQVSSDFNTNTSANVQNCTFFENFQANSKLGNDLLLSVPVILESVVTQKHWSSEEETSVALLSKAIVKSLNVSLDAGQMSSVVTFNQLSWDPLGVEKLTDINVKCSKFAKPITRVAAMTEPGLSSLRISCETCRSSSSYYVGNRATSVVMTPPTESFAGMKCETKNESVLPYTPIYSWCESFIEGKCKKCPQGANCSSGITALPNYWEYWEDNQVKMTRCPPGYCCKKVPCPAINDCSENRQGVLCGRCKSGFSEAFLSQKCVDNLVCNSTWFLWIYVGWLLVVALIFCFLPDLKDLLDKAKEFCYGLFHKENLEGKVHNEPNSHLNLSEENLFSLPHDLKSSTKKGIFWIRKLDKAQKNESHSSSFKYLQIVLFYLQDASLLQVALPNPGKADGSSFVESLYTASHLAVDMINFGKTICLTTDFTPVPKMISKSITGPSILVL